MIEISSKLVSYSEIHKKGSFYISRKRTDTNYLNRFGIEIIFDSEPQFLHQEINSEGGLVQATEIANLNIALSNLLPYGDGLPFSRSREGQSNRYLFGNNVLCAFSSYSDFYSAEGIAQNLIKKQIVRISSAGHYVFSSSNTNIKVTPDSSNIFLVNNCAKDISVDINDVQATLYRNTVLVISSTGGLRYLKKAKKRDEFYSVLNPKTAISTQREITLAAGIPRSFDLLPILDEDELPQQSYIKILSKDGSSSYVYLFLKDYYSGKDVPTDSAENAVAYEVGIGHETIYKSLFFNPQSSYYTLPGITSGYDYLVEIDEDLFRDLQQLPGLNGETEKNVLNPSIKYNGVEYGNGDTFVGGDSPNYEVRYPNYVRLYKVTYEVDKSFPRPGADQKDQIPSETNFDGIPTENVAQDTKALLIESINLKARSLFSSPITWTPIKYQAFWSSSQSAKDIWAIQSINPLKTVTISYPEGSSTSYARFISCTVQKSTFRSAIASYFYEYMSAFQPRKEISNPKSLLISLSDDFTQAQKTKIGQIYVANENAYDYLINTKEFELGNVAKKDLFLNNFDDKDDTQKRIKESDFEISVTVSKLKQLPVLKFDDISTQKIIQIINGE